MTYLPAKVMGMWFHLYLIVDPYSRKIVGAEVHESDDSEHAVHLVRRTALTEGIAAMGTKPVLHGDNGSTRKATTVLAMLNWMGIKPSYSWPRVSDDNAFAESLFRIAKYRPQFPAQGFETLDGARAWPPEFVRWDNVEHRHSGIHSSVTPDKTRPSWRHGTRCTARPDSAIQLAGRGPLGTGRSSTWRPNPERDEVVKLATCVQHTQLKAA